MVADRAALMPSTQRLRQGLAQALLALQHHPGGLLLGPAPGPGAPGLGHFHLVPELFLQVGGRTRFQFPQAACWLAPGQALLLPPLLLHDEWVQPGPAGEPFSNLVLQADGLRLGCHLAHEARPGRPGIQHLEAPSHPQASVIQGWLVEAARLAPVVAQDRWAALQAQALVGAAIAATLRALDDGDARPAAEPVLVARLRVLVQNQLGDAGLSVGSLARQSGCTADHLSQVFRRSTGRPLLGWINQQRLDRAERLLRETAMPVKQVAWACGFASPGYFAQCFRQCHGLAPQAWRLRAAAQDRPPAAG